MQTTLQKFNVLSVIPPRLIRVYAALLSFFLLILSSWLATELTALQLKNVIKLTSPLWHCVLPWNYLGFFAGFALGCLTIYSFYCQQKHWMTAIFGFASALMVLATTLPIYTPWDYYVWYSNYNHNPVTQGSWWLGALFISSAIIITLVLALIVNFKQPKSITSDIHGSSHWATPDEVQATGLKDVENDESVYVGAWQHPKTKAIHYLRSKGSEHVFAYAPTRSGKGVGLVVPSLLGWSGSSINNDLKLENWQLTAGYRKQIGHVVLKLDFTCTDNTGARFNPLFEVRQGINEVRDVQNITDMLVNPDGRIKSDHWSNAANSLLVSTILHVLYAERDKSLTGVREFLANPHRSEQDTLNCMLTTLHDVERKFNWIDRTTGHMTRVHPIVASGARELMNKSEGERSGVISTALTCLKLYRDPIIAENTRISDFSINDLLSYEKPIDLYLGVPPSDLSRLMPLLRLILNLILCRLTEKMEFSKSSNAITRHPILLMLDEFPQFGHLEFFEKALAYIAGYGIRAFLITQDLTQLYAVYGQRQSIISNCHIRTAYAPNTLETAEHLSQYLGSTTVQKQNISYSGNRFDFMLKNKMVSEQVFKRPLLTPDELLRLDANRAVIFRNGHYPIDGQKIYYYQDPVFKARSQIPPPDCSNRLVVDHPWHTVIEPFESVNTDQNAMSSINKDNNLLDDTDYSADENLI